ncbi:hypothetical protein DL765_008009 [Monosporascus sp. GIB2]|nr:hypothetical protein DL765_008009 [Monosporascus sp. GIB2]
MDTFHHFTDLPVGLRRMILAEFLAYQKRASPLGPRRLEPLRQTQVGVMFALIIRQCREQTIGRDRYYTVALVVREASSRRSKGTVYLNPEHDAFLLTEEFDCNPYWAEEAYDPVEYFDPDPFWEDREQDSLRETRGTMFKGIGSCIDLLTDTADDEMPSIYDGLCRISLEDLIAKYNQWGQVCLAEKDEL